MQITTVGLGNLGQLLFFARQQTDGYAKPIGVVPPPIRVGRVLYNFQHLVATIDRIFFGLSTTSIVEDAFWEPAISML